MAFPAFFSLVPGITLRDPLAELLGSADGGLIEYTYADAVKLAGHSCPTVAGAWLMSTHAMRALYREQTPWRGGIAVAFPEPLPSGVTGVIASVTTLLTGAAGAGGFKGLAGHYVRRGLLEFGVSGIAGATFSRVDTQTAVTCIFRPQQVTADPRLGELMPAVVHGSASASERQLFGQLWQDRVRRILIDHGNDPDVMEIRHLP